MKKVVKFGGSSLASAEQFTKVKDIICSDIDRRYVVPSAPGKRFSGDTKVTDMLYTCYAAAEQDEDFSDKLAKIQARYNEIINGLGLTLSLDTQFEEIASKFAAKAGKEYAASRGEYLNGIIMANYLGYEFVDAAEVIRFNHDGSFNAAVTNKIMTKRLEKVERAVIPGFFGAEEDGTIRTFSRGGSDITGSIVARAVNANLYENWTDVSGCMIADPRIIRNPEPITTITYKELRELSYMGASVLHEDAIFPVRQAGIPINIKNTNSPEDKGTMIVEKTCHVPKYTITGIAGKKDFVAINIEKDMMNAEIGFGRKVLEAFEKYGVKDLYAYNGSFDKNLLSELASYRWFDIMKIAAYRQYNDKIPASIECCKTGKMKRNYGVEPMMQLLSGNHRYTEVHNALYDAADELEIMRLLGKKLEEYIVAEI